MTPKEIKAIAIARYAAEAATTERHSREQAEAVASIVDAGRQQIDALIRKDVGNHMHALERRESGRFNYATAVKQLREDFIRLSAYADLIEILEEEPRLIGTLSRLRWGLDLVRFAPQGDLEGLERRGLVDRRTARRITEDAPESFLTPAGHAVLDLYREITTPTEAR